MKALFGAAFTGTIDVNLFRKRSFQKAWNVSATEERIRWLWNCMGLIDFALYIYYDRSARPRRRWTASVRPCFFLLGVLYNSHRLMSIQYTQPDVHYNKTKMALEGHGFYTSVANSYFC